MAARRTVMLWLAIAAAVIVGIPLILLVVGMLLPRDHVARMEIELHSPPERVWSLISDVAGTARWRSDVSAVDVLPSDDGLRFVETAKHGRLTYELMSQEPPRRQVVRVVDDGEPFGGIWTWQIEPRGTGSHVMITEAGFIRNPLFRVMSKLLFPPTATIDAYLRSLAAELGEDVAPRHVAVPFTRS